MTFCTARPTEGRVDPIHPQKRNPLRTTVKILLFLAHSAVLSVQAEAQLVTYKFTGTKFSNVASPIVGKTIAGSVTLDVGATPTDSYNFPIGGGRADWLNGRFSVNAVTDTGFRVGKSLGGDTETSFSNQDIPDPTNYSWTAISALTLDEGDDGFTYIAVVSESYEDEYHTKDPHSDFLDVPNPWLPYADDKHLITVTYLFPVDLSTDSYASETVEFSLDTFVPTVIIIDGHITDIPNVV